MGVVMSLTIVSFTWNFWEWSIGSLLLSSIAGVLLSYGIRWTEAMGTTLEVMALGLSIYGGYLLSSWLLTLVVSTIAVMGLLGAYTLVS
jgi:hypothetical protein